VALGQVFSKYFGFPYQSFHQPLHTHHNPSSRAGTIGQIVVNVPSGLSLTTLQKLKGWHAGASLGVHWWASTNSTDKVRDVLVKLHSGQSGGNSGINGTLKEVRQTYYWLQAWHVKKWCSHCNSQSTQSFPWSDQGNKYHMILRTISSSDQRPMPFLTKRHQQWWNHWLPTFSVTSE
jgi:hypothetical protein